MGGMGQTKMSGDGEVGIFEMDRPAAHDVECYTDRSNLKTIPIFADQKPKYINVK